MSVYMALGAEPGEDRVEWQERATDEPKWTKHCVFWAWEVVGMRETRWIKHCVFWGGRGEGEEASLV